jgi:hypothetical protein
MRIWIEVTNADRGRLRNLAGPDFARRRRVEVEATLRDVLADTIRINPVRTARSRAAWVASLEQVGGSAPAGWRGPRPTAESEGRAAGQVTLAHDTDRTAAVVTNSVPYSSWLEYGTSRTRAFAMVRTALARARASLIGRLRQLFH